MKLSRLSSVAATACAIALTAAAPAFAAAGERTPLNLDEAEPTRVAPAGGGGGLVRTFIGLAVVVAVIYGVYWILKQVKASREERVSGSGLSTLATLPLGAGRSLHMVRAGSEVVLIGVGEHGVTPIRTYAEGEARDAGLLDDIADGSDYGWHDMAAIGGTIALDGADGRADAPAGAGAPSRPPALNHLLDALRRRTVRR